MKRFLRFAAIISAFIMLSGCQNSRINAEKSFGVSTPDQLGVDSLLIQQLIADIHSDKIKNVHSIVIIKNGKQIVEEYFSDYNRNRKHYTASVSKSIGSILLGIAIDNNMLEKTQDPLLETTVSEIFPEYKNIIEIDTIKSKIKLKHILSMTAGLEWDEHTFPYTDRRNDCNKINRSTEPFSYLLNKPMSANPGEQFYYNGGLSLVMSYLIEKGSGMKLDKFAEKYLFNPLNITDYEWEKLPSGFFDTDGGLHLRSIDMAKIGYMFLNDGKWQGKQIISKDWISVSTKMQFKNADSPDYGYQWWCGDFYTTNSNYFTYFASGHGGQKIFVFPKLETVVVITQQVFGNPFGELNNLAILSNYVIPAITNSGIKKANIEIGSKNLNKYAGKYFSKINTGFVVVENRSNKLIMTGSEGTQVELKPLGVNTFIGNVQNLLDVKVEFKTDNNGNVKQVTSSFGFRNTVFEKKE